MRELRELQELKEEEEDMEMLMEGAGGSDGVLGGQSVRL